MVTAAERVELWNSFLHQAWCEARRLHAITGGPITASAFGPLGGRLSDEQQSVLSTLLFCTLAIEARANHLIRELVERGRISEGEGKAVEHLPPLKKWCLLPRLDRRRRGVDLNRQPHQSVAEICACRNALVHVNFEKLSTALPPAGKMLSLYKGFVLAMEDMNLLLQRARRRRRYVDEMTTF